MFAGGCGLFDDGDLPSGINGYVDDLDLRLTQQFIDADIDFSDSVFFGGTLRLLTIPVSDTDNFESSLLVGGQMRIVHDPSGADNADSVVHALRQFGFVIEVRKVVSHFEVPYRDSQFGMADLLTFEIKNNNQSSRPVGTHHQSFLDVSSCERPMV